LPYSAIEKNSKKRERERERERERDISKRITWESDSQKCIPGFHYGGKRMKRHLEL
jgi:hypothetical protein